MNCIVIDPDRKSRNSLLLKLKSIQQLSVIKSFSNFNEIKETLTQNNIEVIFFDIDCMKNGHANFLSRHFKNRPQLVLMSTKKEAAATGFMIEAADFILKPVSKASLVKTLRKISNLMRSQSPKSGRTKELFVKVNGNYVKLFMSDIYYVEASANQLNIHTTYDKYTVGVPLKAIYSRLPEKEFLQVHKSFIVRLDKIESIEDNVLQLGKYNIPVSSTYKQLLLERLKII
jgi:DNA-binding LytR/AlgR family response regulator